MTKRLCSPFLSRWCGARPAVLLALFLGACAPGDFEVEADALPGRYPNQLTSADDQLEFALLGSPARLSPFPTALFAVARSGQLDVEVPAIEPAQLRDVDGDGTDDVVATFFVAELRAANLLDAGSRRLQVDVRADGRTLFSGADRVLGPDALIARVPLPTGPYAVGTISDFLLDPTRDRVKQEGRPLYVRLWYPAASTPAQPADYFLVSETGRIVAESVGATDAFFDAVHASSIGGARPAALAPRPTLLLSTGAGLPVDTYAAIGEDLASHGFLVVGVGHPDGGSGPISYPDGTVSEDVMLAGLDVLESLDDPEQQLALEEQIISAANFEWAQDLLFVLDWIEHADAYALSPRLRTVLALADLKHVGALGHSFGGSAAIWADLLSEDIRASADLDGSIWGAPLEKGPDSRVLILESDDLAEDVEDTSLPRFLAHSRGTTYLARVAGSIHQQFSDLALLVAQLPVLAEALGTEEGGLDPLRVIEIQNAYVRAFFGQELTGRPSALLGGANAAFPEVSLDIVDAAEP